jgi:multidrug efflux pump
LARCRLSQITSTSSGGSSIIALQFNLTLSMDVAEEEVPAAINAAQSYLPSNLPAPPVFSKTNPADAPVLTLGISSDSTPLSQVEDLVETRLAPKLSQLNGVGLVSISGGQKPAVRIQANPAALSSYGIDLDNLRTALTQTSVNQAKVISTVRTRIIRSTPPISYSPASTTTTSSSRTVMVRPFF